MSTVAYWAVVNLVMLKDPMLLLAVWTLVFTATGVASQCADSVNEGKHTSHHIAHTDCL